MYGFVVFGCKIPKNDITKKQKLQEKQIFFFVKDFEKESAGEKTLKKFSPPQI